MIPSFAQAQPHRPEHAVTCHYFQNTIDARRPALLAPSTLAAVGHVMFRHLQPHQVAANWQARCSEYRPPMSASWEPKHQWTAANERARTHWYVALAIPDMAEARMS